MPLVNCKIHLELNWTKNCLMSSIDDTKFKITKTRLYVLIITLSTKDNVNLTKQLNEGFKGPVYWNEYKAKIESRNLDYNNLPRFYLLFKELKDCLFLPLVALLLIIMMVLIELKGTVIESTSF